MASVKKKLYTSVLDHELSLRAWKIDLYAAFRKHRAFLGDMKTIRKG